MGPGAPRAARRLPLPAHGGERRLRDRRESRGWRSDEQRVLRQLPSQGRSSHTGHSGAGRDGPSRRCARGALRAACFASCRAACGHAPPGRPRGGCTGSSPLARPSRRRSVRADLLLLSTWTARPFRMGTTRYWQVYQQVARTCCIAATILRFYLTKSTDFIWAQQVLSYYLI